MKKGPPERSEGVLLSTARRDGGICNPSTPAKEALLNFFEELGCFLVPFR